MEEGVGMLKTGIGELYKSNKEVTCGYLFEAT